MHTSVIKDHCGKYNLKSDAKESKYLASTGWCSVWGLKTLFDRKPANTFVTWRKGLNIWPKLPLLCVCEKFTKDVAFDRYFTWCSWWTTRLSITCSTTVHVFFCIISQMPIEDLSSGKCLGSLTTSWLNRRRAKILSVTCSHSHCDQGIKVTLSSSQRQINLNTNMNTISTLTRLLDCGATAKQWLANTLQFMSTG